MTIRDLAEVYDLGLTQFKAGQWPVLYRSWDEYEVTTRFHIDGEYCLVAEAEAPAEPRIVGFVLGSVINKPGSAWSYGYIIWLCAHPQWRRCGVAGRLTDKLIQMMVEEEGIRIVMADTDPLNRPARRFFRNRGFDEELPHIYMCGNIESIPRYRGYLTEARRESGRNGH
jgi:ribosomal protein S18 acetylase RimI-like enzyme